MKVTPKLRYAETRAREPCAWLIPGAHPHAWMAEMTLWGIPLADARLLPLPECDAPPDRTTAAGVLVVTSHQPLAKQTAIPYSRLSERLLAPSDGRLEPPLTDAEFAAIFPDDGALYVWHPAAGLLRYPPQSHWRVADLLAPPPCVPVAWDGAQPGIALNSRLLSLEPLVRTSLADVARGGRDDIGSSPLTGSTLPPAPGEVPGGKLGAQIAAMGLGAAALGAGALASAAGAIAKAMSAFGSGLAGQAAGQVGAGGRGATGSGGSNWMQRLRDWARQQQQAASQNLDRLRNRQVERLLNMLQSSPDDGLKFALPVAGDGMAHRGLAPPSASLVERPVNFSLSGLGGGRAADFWDLPSDLRMRLMQRYRELANREIALGRHRRAAYIFAELLGDITSAAATLADGGHVREAAVLYEERLKQPLRAAQCLEKGGLWTEAIAVYERLGHWETAGNLYLRLDRVEDARQCFRRVVAAHLKAGDHLAAAKVLEEKLDAPDAAYGTLLGGWPASRQAQKCLDEAFALLARHGQHERATEQLSRFRDEGLDPQYAQPLAACLGRVATTYPQAEIQAAAADLTRTLISRRLPQSHGAETSGLLHTLAGLTPSDRLLVRDCHRYQDRREAERRAREKASQNAPYRVRPAGARLVTTFQLPGTDVEWRAAVASCGDLFAAGIGRNELVLVRANWAGIWQRAAGPPWNILPGSLGVLLADDPAGQGKLFVSCGSGRPDCDQHFPASDAFLKSIVAGPHPGVSFRTLGLAYGMGAYSMVLNLAGDGILQTCMYSLHGSLATMLIVTFDATEMELLRHPVPFYVRGQHIYIGVGNKLFSKHAGQQATSLHAAIRHITGVPMFARPRIVVGCDQGGVVLWGESAASPESTFAMDLANPAVGITSGGHLAAATAEAIEVFDTASGKLVFLGELPGPKSTPIALLPAGNPNRLGMVTESGGVFVYEVSAS